MAKKQSGIKTDGRRVSRVEKEVQAVVAQFLISGIRDELPGLITVSKVMMPADLRSAKVFVSLLLTSDLQAKHEELMEETLKILARNAAEAQHFIDQQLKLRYCPKLQFFEDDTTQQILKVEKILSDLSDQKNRQAKKDDDFSDAEDE